MKTYSAVFTGRHRGAIGTRYLTHCLIKGTSPDQAVINLYSIYDHITCPALKAVSQEVHNPMCDSDQCQCDKGQVRSLPYSADGNILLCYHCYQHEVEFRKERNKELEPSCQLSLPAWESLKIYGYAE